MRKIIVIGMVLFLAACTKKESKEEQALKLYSEAMSIHDQVMPLMDEVYKLERKVKSLHDSLGIDSATNGQYISSLQAALNTLEEANQGMMDWMHNIKDVPVQTALSEQGKYGHHGTSTKGETLTAEAVLQIQQDQKAKIELVKVAMKNSIEEAKQLLVKIEGL